MNSRPKTLQEVCLIRLLLIVLLVLYHSFAPFNGAWRPLSDQEAVQPYYQWVAMGAYAFMLEAFTFISGYIFGYQVNRNGKDALRFRNVFLKKLKRLIVPSVIFSIIYLLVFSPAQFNAPAQAGWQILNGVGHMWYLPMLFWCFVGIWLLERIKIHPRFVIPALFVIAVVSFLPIPLRISSAMYYMFFFYCGYCLKRYEWNIGRWMNKGTIIGMAGLFLISFVGLSTLKLSYCHTPPRVG